MLLLLLVVTDISVYLCNGYEALLNTNSSLCANVFQFFFFLRFSVLKLLKMAKGIRALLDTVVQALPQVGNLGLLFFLLFFIFAALGVELFGRLGEDIWQNAIWLVTQCAMSCDECSDWYECQFHAVLNQSNLIYSKNKQLNKWMW